MATWNIIIQIYYLYVIIYGAHKNILSPETRLQSEHFWYKTLET